MSSGHSQSKLLAMRRCGDSVMSVRNGRHFWRLVSAQLSAGSDRSKDVRMCMFERDWYVRRVPSIIHGDISFLSKFTFWCDSDGIVVVWNLFLNTEEAAYPRLSFRRTKRLLNHVTQIRVRHGQKNSNPKRTIAGRKSSPNRSGNTRQLFRWSFEEVFGENIKRKTHGSIMGPLSKAKPRRLVIARRRLRRTSAAGPKVQEEEAILRDKN